MFKASVQAGSQNLNKEEAIPLPSFSLRSGTPAPIAARESGGALKLPQRVRPAAKRIWALENASSDIFGSFM